MTTSAAENLAGQVVEKKEEKIEKRRALGRGLESLLPGPRAVANPEMARFARDDKGLESTASGNLEAKGAGASAPHEVIAIQAQAIAGNLVTNLDIALIEKNPYQTRYVFDQTMLNELAESIKEQGWCSRWWCGRRKKKDATSWFWASGGCGHRRWRGKIRFRRWCEGSRSSRRRR